MQQFLDQLTLEREDVQDDLESVRLSVPKCRVGDMGCGWGFTTLSLTLELRPSECIGIDQFVRDSIFGVPAFEDVQSLFSVIRAGVIDQASEVQRDDLRNDLRRLFQEGYYPVLRASDIVTGENLPSELDLVYCKKVLKNIFDGAYANPRSGAEAVASAIRNIAHAVKRGGQVCIVEPACEINFPSFFGQSGLKLVSQRRIERGEIIGSRRQTLYRAQYIQYVSERV